MLNAEQRVAAEHGDGPLLIVAGAGTGKTRVIVERVGFLLQNVAGLRPENILALTFTNQAAEEMRRRAVERFGARARRCGFSTFHAFCYGLLCEKNSLRVLDPFDQWIFFRRHLEELELDRFLKVSEPGRFLEDLVEFCSRCHDNLVSPAEYRRYVESLAGDPEAARLGEVARVYERSEELQTRECLVSFGAMISQVVGRLQQSPEWLRQLQKRYAYILVDEFQDTNAAQWELLKLLAGERRNVTVVGDDYQAIYRFRGAADGSLEQFEKQDFTGCKRIGLSQNYRSTKAILTIADAAIAADQDLYDPGKRLTTANEPGSKVRILEFAGAAEEAGWVADAIARMAAGGEVQSFSEIGMLYRMHRHRDLLVAALRRLGIPFAIRGLAVTDLPPVRDLVAYLRAIGRPEDNASFARILADPQWGFTASQVAGYCRKAGRHPGLVRSVVEQDSDGGGAGRARLLELLSRYQSLASEQRLRDWLEPLRRELGLANDSVYEPALSAFIVFAGQWDQEKCATGLLAEFLEYLGYFEEAGGKVTLPEEQSAEDRPGGGQRDALEQFTLWGPAEGTATPGRVQLMTVHAAKGLEFDHVFLMRLVRGAFPARYRRPLISLPAALWKRPLRQGDFHLKEERRLFYVALTRARKTLTLCTISQERQRPSVFLEELRKCEGPEMEWNRPAVAAAREAAASGAGGAAPGRRRYSQIGQWAASTAFPPEQPFSLSASALETHEQCPLKYQFSAVWRIPSPPSAAMLFGAVLHKAIRQVMQVLSQGPPSLRQENPESILRQHWPASGFSDALQGRKYWETGLRQLEGLWQAWSQRRFQILHQEKTFELLCAGTKLVGRVDQIHRTEDGQIELMEYKTGRPQTQKEADESMQLTLYAQACRQALELEPSALILYNLETQEAVRTRRTARDFEALERRIQETAAQIRTGRFPARPGYLCRYCDFRPLCPAQEDSSLETEGMVQFSTIEPLQNGTPGLLP